MTANGFITTIYLTEKVRNQVNSLERGQLTKICNQLLESYFETKGQTMEKVEIQLKEKEKKLKQEMDTLKAQLKNVEKIKEAEEKKAEEEANKPEIIPI